MVSIVTDLTCVREKTLTGETYFTAEVSVHQVYIIRHNTTSCSSVAITLKGLAALEQTEKFSLNRLYFDVKRMPITCNNF